MSTQLTEIWFDTDLGSDVDDALALTYLVRMMQTIAEPVLSTVVTSYGPTQERAQAAATLLRELGQPQIPVFAGQTEPTSNVQRLWFTGNEADSADSSIVCPPLAEHDGNFPNDIVLLVTGPCTNVIELFKKDEFKKKCKEVVVMGGSFQSVPGAPAIENNFEGDPKAVQFLLEQGVPITLIPVDLTLLHPLSESTMAALAQSTDVAHQLLDRWLQNWFEFTKLFPADSPFREQIYLHDPIAAAYIFFPELFEVRDARIVVHETGAMEETPAGFPVRVCMSLRPELITQIESALV